MNSCLPKIFSQLSFLFISALSEIVFPRHRRQKDPFNNNKSIYFHFKKSSPPSPWKWILEKNKARNEKHHQKLNQQQLMYVIIPRQKKFYFNSFNRMMKIEKSKTKPKRQNCYSLLWIFLKLSVSPPPFRTDENETIKNFDSKKAFGSKSGEWKRRSFCCF